MTNWMTRLHNRYDRVIYAPIYERVERRALHHRNPFCIEVLYRKNDASELSRLCDLHGSDKGQLNKENHLYPWPSHTYADLYEMLFEQKREAVRLVVECGLGTNNPNPQLSSAIGTFADPGATNRVWSESGGSLRVWRDYFPHADVIGIDIDKDVLFTEDRIRTFYCDQADPQSVKDFKAAAALQPASVDIIIDDGLHEFGAGRCLFENVFDLLKPDGVYVIEDVQMQDLHAYDRYLAGLQNELVFQVVNLHRPGLPLWDNSLVVVRKKAVHN
jgi:SAM-dependent methyltransferase